MHLTMSPLDLKLDKDNPRFVAIDDSSEESIRKYMAMYEDVCQLAEDINNNGGLLLGERIVVINENNQYIVMEGNRRTAALQFLLNRSLIPNGFEHRIPTVSHETLPNITTIEVDVAPDRDYAIALMSKRHIKGVKDWKPIAKKQFFASMFDNGNSIALLSERTGERASAIRKDIRDYKFLLKTTKEYKENHPEFDEDLINIKIDPFLRIFSAKQPVGNSKLKPVDILRIHYDAQENTHSELPEDSFNEIMDIIFKESIVNRRITTRNTLFDVPGVKDIIDSLATSQNNGTSSGDATPGEPGDSSTSSSTTAGNSSSGSATGTQVPVDPATGGPTTSGCTSSNQEPNGPAPGGPTPGGPTPSTFFENISWMNLSTSDPDQMGLIVVLDELYKMSTESIRNNGRTEKIYQVYSVAAGAVLRTAYELSLKNQLKKTNMWNRLVSRYKFPQLGNIENFISSNINAALPDPAMRTAFHQIVNSRSRDFLNINIHNPGLVRTTSSTLEGLANGGLRSLIQLIINNI